MEKKDLEFLKEITGLVSEGEEVKVSNHNNVVVNDDALNVWVGKFAHADGHDGLIDSVHGNRLGFVYATKDGWTNCLVDPNEVRNAEDDARAKRSAVTYFNRESTTLRHRIRCGYACDDPVKLNTMLNDCETWLRKLA